MPNLGCLNRKGKNEPEKETKQQANSEIPLDPEEHDAGVFKDRFNVNREVYTCPQFTKAHPENVFLGVSLLAIIRDLLVKQCKPSGHCAKRTLLNRVPAIRFVKNYRIKDNLFADILAGINVAIMHIPQGRYALLATLPPIYGLYTLFYPVLIFHKVWLMPCSRLYHQFMAFTRHSIRTWYIGYSEHRVTSRSEPCLLWRS